MPLQLNELIRRSEKALQAVLGDGVVLQLEFAPDLEPILADAAQIEQLLVRLASDARTNGVVGGVLAIETQSVLLDLTPGAMRHVALRVYHGVGAQAPGVGAQAPEVTKRFGATPAATGRRETGSRFVAYFPTTDLANGPRASDPQAEARTVLVAEDNPHLRKTLKTFFAREGCRVLDADGAADILKLLEREPHVHLLVTNFSLDEQRGPSLGHTLRARWPQLKVLFTLGHPEQRAAVNEDGRTATIHKPFELQELGSVTRRLLEEL